MLVAAGSKRAAFRSAKESPATSGVDSGCSGDACWRGTKAVADGFSVGGGGGESPLALAASSSFLRFNFSSFFFFSSIDALSLCLSFPSCDFLPPEIPLDLTSAGGGGGGGQAVAASPSWWPLLPLLLRPVVGVPNGKSERGGAFSFFLLLLPPVGKGLTALLLPAKGPDESNGDCPAVEEGAKIACAALLLPMSASIKLEEVPKATGVAGAPVEEDGAKGFGTAGALLLLLDAIRLFPKGSLVVADVPKAKAAGAAGMEVVPDPNGDAAAGPDGAVPKGFAFPLIALLFPIAFVD